MNPSPDLAIDGDISDNLQLAKDMRRQTRRVQKEKSKRTTPEDTTVVPVPELDEVQKIERFWKDFHPVNAKQAAAETRVTRRHRRVQIEKNEIGI